MAWIAVPRRLHFGTITPGSVLPKMSLLTAPCWEHTNHHLYTPDLSDFHPCGFLKEQLPGKPFATNTDMKQAITSWLQTLDINLLHQKIKVLVKQRGKRLMSVVTTWMSGVQHLLLFYRVYIEVQTWFGTCTTDTKLACTIRIDSRIESGWLMGYSSHCLLKSSYSGQPL
jgi:hypothetical protein